MATLADILRQVGYAQDGTLTAPTDSPMTKVLAEHIKGLPQKFEQNQQNQMNLLSQAYPGNTYESMMTQGDPKALAELGMQAPFNALTAFHGTPHKILGKFDISKVGTGEGAQSYGHGMYFAQEPKVAEGYQKALSGRTDLGQRPSDPAFIHAVESFREYGTPLNEIPAEMKKAYKSATDKDIQLAIQATEKGNLYKVDIPNEHIPNMLDWDKPLSQQTPEVQQALAKANPKFYDPKSPSYDPNESGQWAYMSVAGNVTPEAQQIASAKLNELGIKGIRYLDEGSRASKITKTPIAQLEAKIDILKKDLESGLGNKEVMERKLKVLQDERARTTNQTSNFVIFDPTTVKILEENSKPLSRKELIEQQVNKVIE